MNDKIIGMRKITENTLIPISALGAILYIFAIMVSDHNTVKALAEDKKDTSTILRRLDKKVTILMVKFNVKVPADGE